MIAGSSNSIMHGTKTDEARAERCVTEEKHFTILPRKQPPRTCYLTKSLKNGRYHGCFAGNSSGKSIECELFLQKVQSLMLWKIDCNYLGLSSIVILPTDR